MITEQLPFEKVAFKDLIKHIQQFGTVNVDSNTCGFFLCENGRARIQLDQQIVEMCQGDVFIYTPASYPRPLSWSADVNGTVVKSTMDRILPIIMPNIQPKDILGLQRKPIFHLNDKQLHRIQAFTTLIEQKLFDLRSTTQNSNMDTVLHQQLTRLSEAYVLELITCYLSGHQRPTVPTERRGEIFQNFIINLFRHYQRERSATFYASLQHLSLRYFSLLIKAESGRSVNQWINEIVLGHVRQKLLHSTLSIKEISNEFNFPDQSFFGKYFKQHTGLSPKAFRQAQALSTTKMQ